MDVNQARHYVRVYILSDGTNPPEALFIETMAVLKNKVLDELARYCDELIRNFIHTHGNDAPGIAVAERAKLIILSSKG